MSNKHKHIKKIETTLIDFIIPVYGRFDLLKRCIASIPAACNGLTYKVYMVDNHSPDQVEAQEFYGSIKDKDVFSFRNKENLGFPRATNQGFRRGSSPLVMFLNSDVILDPGSVEEMVKAMDDPKIGVVGMKLVFPGDIGENGLVTNEVIRPQGKIQHVGLSTNVQGNVYHHFLGWSENNPKVEKVREVYAVTGAALMTRRALFAKVGGFLEAYGAGNFEDVDYCLTVREMGYNVIVEIKARAIHYAGATAETFKIHYPFDFNRLIFLQRWSQKLNYTELWVL